MRILTGRFGDTAQQMAALCEECGAVGQEWGLGYASICQLWRTEHQGLMAYPTYIFLFGSCGQITVPQSRETPLLTDLAYWSSGPAHRAPFANGMVTPNGVPQWQGRSAKTELHLGAGKQKKVEWTWWRHGVHQLVQWLGTAKTGQQAKINRQNGKGAKGTGKGKGRQTVSDGRSQHQAWPACSLRVSLKGDS